MTADYTLYIHTRHANQCLIDLYWLTVADFKSITDVNTVFKRKAPTFTQTLVAQMISATVQ